MEHYRKQQSELYFTDDGKRHLVEAITSPAAQRPQRPRRRLHAAAAVAAALALTVSAGALSPGIRGMLSEALGGFRDYAQEVQTEAVVDQGIEIKVLSAMADSTATVVYAQARDLTGDRLNDDSLRVDGSILNRTDAAGTSALSWSEYVGYDEETGAALLKFVRITGQPGTEADMADLELTVIGFQSQGQSVRDLPLPNDLLTAETLHSFRLSEEEIIPDGTMAENPTDLVLEPGQTTADLGSELVSLSSMGFAADGRLHILLEVPADAVPSTSSLQSTLRSRYLESLGADIDPEMAKEYFYRYNDLTPGIWFTRDGGFYYDRSYPAGPEALDDLLLETVDGTVSFSERIWGNWSFPLTVETLSEARLPLAGPLGEISTPELVLSPLSVGVYVEDSSQPGCMSIVRAPMAAYLRDGKQLKGEMNAGVFGGDGTFYCGGIFPEPVDLEQLAGISIGDWMIPIEGDTAGVPYSIG